MVGVCCIPECPSTNSTDTRLSFHRFPKDKLSERRKKWLKAVQRDNIPTWTKICSMHFMATDFRRTNSRNMLSDEAVPTQNLPAPCNDVVNLSGEEMRIENDFHNCCRFCLESIGGNAAESIRIDWFKWPLSDYSTMFEEITKLKFPVSVNCSEHCCSQCAVRLKVTLNSLNLFRNAYDFWQKLLQKKIHKIEASQNPEYVDVKDYVESVLVEEATAEENNIAENAETMKPQVDSQQHEDKLLDVCADGDGLWPCKYCDIIKKSKDLLQRHIRNVHFPHLNRFECDSCPKRLYSLRSLRFHKLIHTRTSDSIVECHQCFKQFPDDRLLRKHLRTVHASFEPVECTQCGRNFSNAFKMQWHIDFAHGSVVAQAAATTTYQCDICNRMYNNKIAIRRHIKSVHQKYHRFICDGCAAPFYTVAALKRHLPRCNRQNNYQPRRTQHKKSSSGELMPPPISCVLCAEIFDNKTLLRQHYLQRHSVADGMDTVCIWCNTQFAVAHQLQQHQSVALVRCDQCRSSQKCPTEMEAHKRRHSQAGQKNQCELCQKVFLTLKIMKRHKRIVHLSERPFKCDECDKTFIDRFHLKTHKKSHFRQRNQVVD